MEKPLASLRAFRPPGRRASPSPGIPGVLITEFWPWYNAEWRVSKQAQKQKNNFSQTRSLTGKWKWYFCLSMIDRNVCLLIVIIIIIIVISSVSYLWSRPSHTLRNVLINCSDDGSTCHLRTAFGSFTAILHYLIWFSQQPWEKVGQISPPISDMRKWGTKCLNSLPSSRRQIVLGQELKTHPFC